MKGRGVGGEGFREEFGSVEDYDLCLRLSEVTEVWHLNQPFYYYRNHPSNTSNTQHIEQALWSQKAINDALVRRDLCDRASAARGSESSILYRRKASSTIGEIYDS